jgi:hypothetical protein
MKVSHSEGRSSWSERYEGSVLYIRVGPWLLILSDCGCGWAKVERLVQVQQLALSGEQNEKVEQLFMKDH